MRLYLQIAKNTWDEMTTYRFNFIMWRVRNVLQLLTVYYLWLAVTPQHGSLFGYSQSAIVSYILGASLVGSIVFSSRTQEMGENINSGELSQYLIRPVTYFGYWFARDIGDKLFNISFAVVELALLFIILKPSLYIQTDTTMLIFSILALCLAIVSNFFIGCLLSMIAFWSPEFWAPRFIFYMLISFFAGGLFPLDILPQWFQYVVRFSPFTYLQYFPLKIYLGGFSTTQIWQGLIISAIWAGVFYLLLHYIWKKGLRMYSSQGG